MIYFDHAATTPMRPTAVEAWVAASSLLNPAVQYALGRAARSALDSAREEIASLLGCEPIEVIFTSSGTEANNIALGGYHRARGGGAVIASAIEHSAVYETVRSFHTEVIELPVEVDGIVQIPEDLPSASVATLMWANNETGAIQPVAELIAAAGDTPVHVDAVQAVGKVPINFAALGAQSLAASAHKFGGPRGVGLLLMARSPKAAPILFGGGQERGLRPGTVDVAGAVATAAALREALATPSDPALRDALAAGVSASIPDVVINTPARSLPTHLNVSFPGAEGDSLIMLLDQRGIAAATGSACSRGVNRASRVLLAQGVPEATARGTLRFSLGYTTTQDDVDTLLAHLPAVVDQARRAGMA